VRILLLLLVLANFAWLAYTRLVGAAPSVDAPLVQQQINRDAIKLLNPAQMAAPAAASRACLEWGAFNPADASRAADALSALSLGDRLTQRRVDDAATWWVFIPAKSTRQAAQQKAAELKRLGVEEYFIIADDSKSRYTISLGVFHSEDSARTRLQELRGLGVNTAQAGPRDSAGTRVYFQVRGAGDALAAKLDDLSRGFSGSDVRDCAGGAAVAQAPSQSAPPAVQPAASAPAATSPNPDALSANAGLSMASTLSAAATKAAGKAAVKAGAAKTTAAKAAPQSE
jgi:hypothetical protein